MKNIDKEDIYIFNQHSTLSEKGISTALMENSYSDKKAWEKFLKFLLFILGIGFTISGIVFFFAYNWDDIDKFVKIGMVETLVTITTILVLFPNINHQIRSIILTCSSILVGVLFAVFGQIYQTGANAYDFFLAWTLCITLWVLVSNFAPIWTIYLILINTTFFLYTEQVAHNWSLVLVHSTLFVINTTAFLIALLLSKKGIIATPKWFFNMVALAIVSFATMGIIFGIFDKYKSEFPILVSLTIMVYATGLLLGLKEKNGFFLSIIPFSVIVILSALFIKISDHESMFLFISFFIIVSVSLVIKGLLFLQKKWANETR